ncbi:ABC transporter substrate-binding protein [Streptomyces luteolus]|uniref:ABC transporter substrate-binding protein n=1 Tax=Streptomyces luteolus TaxID=3043615 RepID=A0ABT6T2V9_9ACTN|nr:ABC transporter substrate-binding protein [Streptomyces sp. B-S-A12]MDI3422211.1 ABC transporter substrate-binding protein [Streptomyces sp. B-S-A12]
MKRAPRVHARTAAALVAMGLLTSACVSPGEADGGNEQKAERGRYEFGIIGNQGKAGKPVRGGTLHFADYTEARSLSPAATYATGASGGSALAAVYDVLMRYDTKAEKYEPWLAKSLKSSKDSKTWTLRLREDVTFSDGTPLNAKAVVGSIEWYQESKGADATLLAANIAETSAPDDHTVVFTMRRAWAGFPARLAQAPGMIVAPAARAGKTFKPIGAGPFTLQKHAPQEEMVLKANKDYWKGEPYLDALRFTWPNSDRAKLEALEDGGADVTYVRSPEVVDEAVKAGHPGELTLTGLGNMVTINTRKGRPGQDIRVRKAVAFALDPVLDTKRSYQGKGLPGQELFPPESRWHSKVEPLGVDLAAAKKLLAAAKKDGYDGTITYMDGTDPVARAKAVVTKAQLERVGFKVKLDLVSSTADRVSKTYVDHDFDLSRGAASVSEGDPFHRLQSVLDSKSYGNPGGYADAEMDELLVQLQGAASDQEKQQALDAVQRRINETVPVANLGASAAFTAWGKDVHGIVPTDEYMALFGEAWLSK